MHYFVKQKVLWIYFFEQEKVMWILKFYFIRKNSVN